MSVRDSPAVWREYQRQWRRDHPEASRLSEMVRHANAAAKRYGVEGRITIADVRAVVVGAICLYCGTADRVGIDHRVAMGAGGPNVLENLDPCCESCNQRKRLAETPDSWSETVDACVECGTTERAHHGLGQCQQCYDRLKVLP